MRHKVVPLSQILNTLFYSQELYCGLILSLVQNFIFCCFGICQCKDNDLELKDNKICTHQVWTFLWVPADVGLITHFPPNCQFFRWNHCISRIVLNGKATNEISATTYNNNRNEKSKKATGLISKTKTLNWQHTFWPISLPSFYD